MPQQPVRRLRHWKQRFKKDAAFIWRRDITYAGERCKMGSKIPEDLTGKPTKLRRFWESRVIELADFEAPDVTTGQSKKDETPKDNILPEGITVEKLKGTWLIVRRGDEEHKVNGKKGLNKLLEAFGKEEPKKPKDPEKSDETKKTETEGSNNSEPEKGEDDSWLDGEKSTSAKG